MSTKALSEYHFLRLGEETLRNPYPFFAQLRAECPVFQESDYGVFLVSRYDDVVAVSGDTDTFSAIANASGPFAPLPCPLDQLSDYRVREPASEKIFTNDPPDHTRYRRLVNAIVTSRRLADLTVKISEKVDDLLDRFPRTGPIDFVTSFANVLPVLAVGELMGIPERKTREFCELFASQFARMDEAFVGKPDSPVVGVYFANVFAEYFSEQIEERRKQPRDDVLSQLANARFPDGQLVPLADIVQLGVTLFSAGGDANTPQLLANGARILAERPDISAQLRREPALIAKFVEETLRFETSALGLFRVAKLDTSVNGTTVPKGSMLMMLFGSANRDEEHFEEPDSFRLDRARQRIMSFSHGPHTCPGAPLARLEATISFRRLLERFGDIRVAREGKEFRYLPSCILRSVRELRLEFQPTATA